MPPVIIAAVAAVAAAAVAAAPAVIAVLGVYGAIALGAVVGAVLSIGLSYAFGLMGGADKRDAATNALDNKQMVRGAIEARRVIYGQARVSGPLVYAFSFGANKEMLGLVICLAGHQVAGIDTVWVGETAILPADIPAGPAGGHVLSGDLAGLVWVYKHLGTPDQAANAQLILDSPDGWDANHRLRGVAYIYVRLAYNRDKFQGIPSISALVRGKDTILDPRTGTSGYTTNWALCVRDYLTSDLGMRCGATEIDEAYFVEAANLSDEQVQIDDTGLLFQTRYTVNGTYKLDEQPIDIVGDLLAAGAGALVYVQGRYRLHGGAYNSPSVALTTSDFAGPMSLQTKPSRAQLFNSVKGTFISPDKFWQISEFPAIQDSTALAEDGEEAWREADFRFVINAVHAQRLAKQALKRNRSPLILKVPLRYAGLRLAVLDTVALTVAEFGWTSKPFSITALKFSPAEGSMDATFQEERVAAYGWLYDEASLTPNVPTTTLISPIAIPAPTDLTVSATTVLQGDGATVPALEVTWTAAAHPFVTSHEVQWRTTSGPGPWLSMEVAAGTNRALITPVVTGTAYDIRVRAVAGLVRGPFASTVNGTGAPDTTAPGQPTGLSVTGTLRGFFVRWTNPADSDLDHIKVYASALGSPAPSDYIEQGRSGSDFAQLSGYNPDDFRHFAVRAFDRSGNYSALTYAGSGTIPRAETNDILAFAASSNASVTYSKTFEVITAPGSGYSWGSLGSGALAVGGDGRVVIHSKPPRWTTSSPTLGGGDGG